SKSGGEAAPFSQGVSPIRYLCSQSMPVCQLSVGPIDRSLGTSKNDFKLPSRTSVWHPCSEKGLNQKSDPNHTNTQARQPEHPASDQDRNRSDRNGYLEHGDAARQHLVGAQMSLSILLQSFGLFGN